MASLGLCIASGGKVLYAALAAFTLTWTHSVEKIGWQEDWIVNPDGLKVVSARIKGSGAGMDPPADAVFDGEWWHYTPHVPPQPRVALGRSGEAGAWHLCMPGHGGPTGRGTGVGSECVPLPEGQDDGGQNPLVMTPCARPPAGATFLDPAHGNTG